MESQEARTTAGTTQESHPTKTGRSYSRPKRLPGKNVYCCRVYDKATGKRTWVSTGCTTKEAAVEWKKTREIEEAMGPTRVQAKKAEGLTFAGTVDQWLEEKEQRVSAGRHAIYSYQAAYWKTFFGTSRRLAEVTADDLQAFLRRRKSGAMSAAKGEPARPLSATTGNEEIGALRNFFGWCVRSGRLAFSPALALDRYRGEIRRKVRTLNDKEEEDLLRACREKYGLKMKAKRNTGGPRGGQTTADKRRWKQGFTPPPYLAPLVATALRTGLRRRTLLSLRWQDADLKGGTWNIPGEAMKTARPYTQPIAPSVVAELTAYRRRLLEKKGATAVKPGAPIFQLGAGATFKRAFKSAVERAGLKGLTFHGLRAAFLNRLRDRGIPIDVAAELTGHASLQVLMKHYREVPAAETRKAVQALDQVEAKEAKA